VISPDVILLKGNVKPPKSGPLLELEFRTNEPHPKAVPRKLEISLLLTGLGFWEKVTVKNVFNKFFGDLGLGLLIVNEKFSPSPSKHSSVCTTYRNKEK